jgi:hypothetical protein
MGPSPKPAEEELAERQVAYGVLNDIFININEQLRFAETKNGALVTLNLAIVLATATILADHIDKDARLPLFFENWFIGVALWLAIAALVSLASFLPEMRPRVKPASVVADPSNVFFFGHIRAWSEPEFLKRVFEGMGLTIAPLQAHHHLANQIGSNSHNANKKFVLFALAAVITLTALGFSSLLLAGSWLIWGI